MNKLFGTDGVRGIANKGLSIDLASKIGKAAARILIENNSSKSTKPKVLIGKDTRISGDMLELALSAGFCSVGVDVVCVGVIPTPAVAYLTEKYNCDAGVMISASHNPFEYNGIKIFQKNGYKLPDSMEEEIEYIISNSLENETLKSDKYIGKRTYCKTAIEDYVNHIVRVSEVSFDGLSIAIDTANGSASVCAKEIFTKLGAKCHMLFDTPNGININDDCGSTHIECLKDFVKANKLDLGIAFDGDADRLIAVDEKGNVLDGDKIISICANQMKKENKLKKNTVVVTVMSNMGFFRFCDDNEINCEKVAVGDRYVLECMIKNGYNIGGEQSGHVIFLDYAKTGDGELTAVKLIETLVKSKTTLSTLANRMTVYPQVLINITVTDEGKQKYNNDEYIISAIQKAEMELNGSGRVLVRVSGTEPLIRVMLEGENIEKITKLGNDIADVVKERLK